MKRVLAIALATIFMAVSCSPVDYEAILDQLRDHEDRIQKLETLCTQLNRNVEAIQIVLEALKDNDFITDITKITEGGVEIGYSITFAQSGTINIYHGSNGADGNAPQIGIRKAQDGEYYWTSDNEWLTDENGDKIPASVPDDPEGKYTTPLFRVAEGIWYVSFDKGNTWREVMASEETEQLFDDVTYDNDNLYLTLQDGTVISVPRNAPAEDEEDGVVHPFTIDGFIGPGGIITEADQANVVRTTEFIDITNATSIYYHGRMGPVSNYYSIGFYDADKKFLADISISGTGNIETYYITLNEAYKKAKYVRGSWAKGPNLKIEDTYDFIFIIDAKPVEQVKKKRFAVLCDSIGTHGSSGEYCNVVEVEITPEDVGVELNAYLTYYDVHDTNNGNKATGTAIEFVLGGQTFTEADNGKLITFTPTAEDIGKKVGRVYNYNPNSLKTWWMWLAEAYNMEPIPVCWSSSSISSHETTTPRLVNSYAWHDSQVRKCGVRKPGSNDRIAPDYIIIARGCNDWSHGKGTLITDGYFDNPETWTYPTTDVVGSYFGIKEAISLTVKNMREAYPEAKIYLCTITYNNRGSKDTFPPCYGGKSMVSFNRAIRECAEFFGCGLLDLAACGVTHENLKTFAPDGTHLNAAGHELAGRKAIADFKPDDSAEKEYNFGPVQYGSITTSPSGLRGGIVDYLVVRPDFQSAIIGKHIKKIKVYRTEDQNNPAAATIKIGKIRLNNEFNSGAVTVEELDAAYACITSVHTYNVSSFPYDKVMELECDITLYENEYLCFVTKDGHCVGYCDNAVSQEQMMYIHNNKVHTDKSMHMPIAVVVEN